ncbi:restriction endonuclease subunit S [Ruegeria sp. TM1040]|uniref:restriction endonuclease subunit S n=1 Tax=Ruegeria sp. (strain TM1040) TaxID=292414 RepID=UPI0000462A76|nr:restriction endonuclease subunit S [Ruegeria sp. TM1040]
MADNEAYRLVTVKRARGGVVERGTLDGREISVKSQFIVEGGDFLISKRQIVHGACGLVPQELAGSVVSNEYSVLNSNGNIDLQFLNYLAHTVFFQQTCFHSSIGVHVEKMIFKLDRWLKWEFDLPPLSEQRKIVEILSTWDRAIEVAEAQLANARKQKRALMQSLLTGKRRFPEFEGQEWREVWLADLVSAIRGGGTPDKSNTAYWGGEIPWVSVKDLKSDVLQQTKDTITQSGLNSSAANYFPKGTIVVATRMAVGAAVQLGKGMAINQDLKAIIPGPDVRNDYLFHFMQMVQPKLEALGTGSTVKGITLGDLHRLVIGLPATLEEQDKIVQMLDVARKDISSMCVNIGKLRAEKKALMQQLLTGKRRVTG